MTRLKDYGSKVCIQLGCGAGRNVYIPGVKSVAPSEELLVADPSQTARALTVEEIQQMVKSFCIAAAMAKDTGFDCIEIHAHTGYLLDEFLSECWIKCADQYGGSHIHALSLGENHRRLQRYRQVGDAVRAAYFAAWAIH